MMAQGVRDWTARSGVSSVCLFFSNLIGSGVVQSKGGVGGSFNLIFFFVFFK